MGDVRKEASAGQEERAFGLATAARSMFGVCAAVGRRSIHKLRIGVVRSRGHGSNDVAGDVNGLLALHLHARKSRLRIHCELRNCDF